MVKTEMKASHLVGGTMVYECLGNDNYKITLTVYRDCSSATQFDAQAPIAIFNASRQQVNIMYVPLSTVTNVPIIINNPCLISPPNVCIQKADYILFTHIAPSPGGLDIVYQRCCRNGNAVNIISPTSMGSTYTAHIPDSGIIPCNNSPLFNNPPPTIMCAGYQFDYDLSVTDIDGDSLYYEFADVINGGSSANPSPNPAPPPHSNILWNSGYSTNYQIDANPLFTINPQTGFLSGTPTNPGFYTFGIKVKEFRNGVFLDEIKRDFLLVVTNCQTNTVADFPPQIDYCIGTTLYLQSTSLNTSLFFWDFGDPTTNADTSLFWDPFYTFADTGTYNVMLIANPGYFCADTIFHEFTIHQPIVPSFSTPTDQCLLNNSFSFNAIGNNNPNDTVTWNFGATAVPSSFLGGSSQVTFPSSGSYPIELTIQNHGCIENYFDTVTILENPTALFPPQVSFCDGLSVSFGNNSTNATNYFWDFGDGATTNAASTLMTPVYTYADSGIYNISLIASQQDICYDTTSKTFNVYPPLIVTFAPQAIQCFPNNSFSLNALGNFNATANINWNFGSLGSPSTFNGKQTQVSFLDTGFHTVSLTIQNYGCASSFTDTLYVFPIPTPNFTILADTGCQPFTSTFYDNSFSWTPLSYFWDFGDGNTSTSAIPTHTYLSSGTFDVTLTIATDSGCVDTNTLYLPNLITVNPKPESKFIINPIETFFLNHVITVDDRSDVLYQEFNFGDGSIFTDRHIEYSYIDTGHYLFEQLVVNEFNCKDTSYQKIWIKPDFLFFVPNTFTPDGDGLNDFFSPKIQGIIEYKIYLFNRWGELYFTSDDLSKGWDGTFKNQPALIGTYNWRIEVKTIDHQIYKRIGHINLIR